MSISSPRQARALVYCQGALGTTNGKTANGLIRRSDRYQVMAVVDRVHEGKDAGEVIGGEACGIPVFAEVGLAIRWAESQETPITHFVIGLAPGGGRLSLEARRDVERAIESGLDIHSGLHDFLSDDPSLHQLAKDNGVDLIDIRRPPPRNRLHFFEGKIEQVSSPRVAVLGTDSAVGKRTTSWILVEAFNATGIASQLIGTSHTAWLQGCRFGIVLDSLVNDFVSGEIEHAIFKAWQNTNPNLMVIEGHGSLLNPAYPGGFEILSAGRPEVVILQHAPARSYYDGFPGCPIHPIERQIEAIQVISERPVIALTLNRENLDAHAVREAQVDLEKRTGLPVFDPFVGDDVAQLVEVLRPLTSGTIET